MKVIIDKGNKKNLRIAVIDANGILQNLYYDTNNEQLKGRIYVGYISRIESSLQAAFVDYGGKKNGFLPLSEISVENYNISEKEKEIVKKSDDDNNKEDNENDNEFEQINNNKIKNFNFYKKYRIQDILHVGQIVLVQITKEERGHKGVTLSTYINLPSVYCILFPNSPKRSGISNKISELKNRDRLSKIQNNLDIPNNMSVIMRKTSVNKSFQEIKEDFLFLIKKWQIIDSHFTKIIELSKKKRSHNFIQILYNDNNFIQKFLRDHWCNQYEEIIVSEEDLYAQTNKAIQEIFKKSTIKIILLRKKIPLFANFNIESQIANLYDDTAYLDSGAHIVIHKTEALIAIDINSGKMTCESSVEETAFKTNMEAIPEIVRQLRLRELSGIIIIDFIDMNQSQKRGIVEQELKNELSKNDKAKIQISRISPLGIVQMSRQRMRSSFQEIFAHNCNSCNGKGYIRNVHETTLAIVRAIESDFFSNFSKIKSVDLITVYTNSTVASYFLNESRDEINNLENKLKIKIKVIIDNRINQELFNINFSTFDNSQKIFPNNSQKEIQKLTELNKHDKKNFYNSPDKKSILKKIVNKFKKNK